MCSLPFKVAVWTFIFIIITFWIIIYPILRGNIYYSNKSYCLPQICNHTEVINGSCTFMITTLINQKVISMTTNNTICQIPDPIVCYYDLNLTNNSIIFNNTLCQDSYTNGSKLHQELGYFIWAIFGGIFWICFLACYIACIKAFCET
jgi:hypothetical protein